MFILGTPYSMGMTLFMMLHSTLFIFSMPISYAKIKKYIVSSTICVNFHLVYLFKTIQATSFNNLIWSISFLFTLMHKAYESFLKH